MNLQTNLTKASNTKYVVTKLSCKSISFGEKTINNPVHLSMKKVNAIKMIL